MMKQMRRFNWKARQGDVAAHDKKVTTKKKTEVIVDSSLKDLKTDENNPLLLPSKKEKLKKKSLTNNVPSKPPLSKKKKKMLEQMLARKEKKANRFSLFEELEKYKLGDKELELLGANSDLQSKTTKRPLEGSDYIEVASKKRKLKNSIRGAFKKKNLLPKPDKPKPWENDPSILGPDPSSSSDEEDEKQDDTKPNEGITLINGRDTEIVSKESESVLQQELTEHGDSASLVKLEPPNDEELALNASGNDEEGEDEETTEECESSEDSDEESEKEEDVGKKEEREEISVNEAQLDTPSTDACNPENKEESSEETSTKYAIPKNPNYVPIHRTPEMSAARLKLPIMGMEQEIMEAISENPIVVICGETGSGKTTQLPQFLYEAGYAKDGKIIGITEPRRVAASAMSFRVQKEMSLSSREVSYQTRFEGTLSPDTKILFMTDGVLIKMIEEDAFVSKFSAIIIDEAHERSIHSDLLIGLFSRVVHIRQEQGNPLKLIIMSATLKVEEFTSNPHLFKTPPPLLKVDSRQFPVEEHFIKHTPNDREYLDMAYSKICKIHRRLPEGGILVFVTGKNEIDHLVRRLRQTFRSRASKNSDKAQSEVGENKENGTKEGMSSQEEEDEIEKVTEKEETKLLRKYKHGKGMLPIPTLSLDKYSVEPKMDEDDEDNDAFEDILKDDDEEEPISSRLEQPLYVLPLYAKLPPEKQKLVFKGPPPGSRLCVIATNVAETSITIPNIKYVVDTGKVKMRLYDKVSGISKYQIFWISKASAQQRKGRAGRTAPGHCYRLYSSSVYNDQFPPHTPPEISKKPLDDIVLQLKNLGVLRVIKFPFPTQPSEESLMAAEERLIKLGAIRGPPKDADKEERERLRWMSPITQLGDKMAQLPISPKFSRILIAARKDPCLPYLVALVAAISVEEIFLDPSEARNEDERTFWKKVKLGWTYELEAKKLGDLALYLKAVVAADEAGMTKAFSREYGIRHKALVEIKKTRDHIYKNLIKIYPELAAQSNLELKPPNEKILRTIREVILTGLLPYGHIARRIPNEKGAYESMELNEKQVFIHPSSMLFKNADAHFVAYQEMIETSKLYLKGVSMVEVDWIPRYAYSECTFSDPMEDPSPRYDPSLDKVVCYMRARWGNWEFPAVEVPFPDDMIERFKWFGYHFLNGDVIPSLKEVVPQLVLPANTMVKTWAHLKPQAVKLLDALRIQKVDSKKRLLKVWERIPNYLLSEYREWLKKDHTATILQNWPPRE